MYTKQDLVNSIRNELIILKHLWSKVNESNKDFGFSEIQRTNNQLLFYLSRALPAQVKWFIEGKMDNNDMIDLKDRETSFDYNNFGTKIDEVTVNITELLATVTDEQMNETIEIFWTPQERRLFLLDMLTFIGAYKMQLFLQLKSSGLKELNTANLRMGIDKA